MYLCISEDFVKKGDRNQKAEVRDRSTDVHINGCSGILSLCDAELQMILIQPLQHELSFFSDLNTVPTSPPNSSLTDLEDLKISPKCHMSVKKENDWLLKL